MKSGEIVKIGELGIGDVCKIADDPSKDLLIILEQRSNETILQRQSQRIGDPNVYLYDKTTFLSSVEVEFLGHKSRYALLRGTQDKEAGSNAQPSNEGEEEMERVPSKKKESVAKKESAPKKASVVKKSPTKKAARPAAKKPNKGASNGRKGRPCPFDLDKKIELIWSGNPRRPYSAAWNKYELYTNGMKVRTFLDKGGRSTDLKSDISKKFVKLVD